ncbi:MAG: hypothetical protein AAGH83_00615 [Pseudomonadota bacterium]
MKSLILSTAAAAAIFGAAHAADVKYAPVKSHPSQGEVAAIEGATARMSMHDDGLFVAVDTVGLNPGHVHTLWLVVINDPAACYDPTAVIEGQKTDPNECTIRDVLLRTDEVKADVGYAGGVIVGDDGTARFAWHQPEGDLTNAWFGRGMEQSHAAEIHVVVNDHGPLLEGRESEMLGSYRDGCKDDSIPGPMPATARADGEAGPNVCRLMQTAVFTLENTES